VFCSFLILIKYKYDWTSLLATNVLYCTVLCVSVYILEMWICLYNLFFLLSQVDQLLIKQKVELIEGTDGPIFALNLYMHR